MQQNHFSFTQSFQIPGLGIVKGANRKKLDLPVQTAEGIVHRCIAAKSLETLKYHPLLHRLMTGLNVKVLCKPERVAQIKGGSR